MSLTFSRKVNYNDVYEKRTDKEGSEMKDIALRELFKNAAEYAEQEVLIKCG